MKKASVGKSDVVKQLENEFDLLSHCDHEHILKVYSMEKMGESLGIIMERADCDYINFWMDSYTNTNYTVNFEVHLSMLYQIAKAMNYLHKELRVCHNDIKMENILVKRAKHFMICDFGYAIKKNTEGEISESVDQ